MKSKDWHGIMKIIEIKHLDVDGTVLWKQEHIHNIIHNEGEEYILRAAFTGGRVSSVIPDNYYVGLDNRSVVDVTDTMDDLVGEPATFGYERQPIASSGDFVINFQDDHYIAQSPIIAFQASGGTWGPVVNLFFTNLINNTGYLISTATFDSAFSVQSGQSVTLRVNMLLRDCINCPA